MAFNTIRADNLNQLLQKTDTEIVLTTTHRIHHDCQTWSKLFSNRRIFISAKKISKINIANTFGELGNRCQEILQWIQKNPQERFIIIDDDKSLHNLPSKYKDKWVETSFLVGFSTEKLIQAFITLEKT